MQILIYFIFRDHVIRYLLLPIPPQQNQVLVDLQPGTTMAIAMMKTTMKNVDGTGKTVVGLMLIQHIVLLVNAWIHKEDHLKNLVDHPTGSMMVIVMMKTTMKHVVGMGRIAVETI